MLHTINDKMYLWVCTLDKDTFSKILYKPYSEYLPSGYHWYGNKDFYMKSNDEYLAGRISQGGSPPVSGKLSPLKEIKIEGRSWSF